MMNGTSSAHPRTITGRRTPPPVCEGWLDKYALCRGVFTTKGWHRRYVFLTCEGLGFCHSNPREKGNCPDNRPLRPHQARTFIPFTRQKKREVELQPVYVVDDLSAARHPAVPQRSRNGICSETVSVADGGSSAMVSARDHARTGSATIGTTTSSSACTFYYFGVTFEEHHKRYLLLLRTDSPLEYIKWTTYLPLFVHEGSATRVVPLGHPLEMGRPQPVDVNYRRLTDKKESILPCTVGYYLDPDPCTPDEYAKARRMCLGWDEGEREHLFRRASDRVESFCGQSESTATESLVELQVQSEEDYRRSIWQQFNVLGPAMPAYEAQRSPHSKEYETENSASAASPNASQYVEGTDAMADDVSGQTRSKQATHTFLASPQKASRAAQTTPQRVKILARPPGAASGTGDGFSEASARRVMV